MGMALADAASEYGAEVTLVTGPVSISPVNIPAKTVRVNDARSMADECISAFPENDIAILSAAVADFTPVRKVEEKIRKKKEIFTLELKPTVDIAESLGKMKKNSQFIAGFALETDNEIANASEKMKRKNMDIIVLNSLKDEGAGFEYDTNKITIIDKYNNIDKFELKSKEDTARDILDKIISMIR
jgi:phosphopantothenoylcysteine decarboxylase/phosphopantothenate--cysteine ligase